jgi:hypothetical protein
MLASPLVSFFEWQRRQPDRMAAKPPKEGADDAAHAAPKQGNDRHPPLYVPSTAMTDKVPVLALDKTNEDIEVLHMDPSVHIAKCMGRGWWLPEKEGGKCQCFVEFYRAGNGLQGCLPSEADSERLVAIAHKRCSNSCSARCVVQSCIPPHYFPVVQSSTPLVSVDSFAANPPIPPVGFISFRVQGSMCPRLLRV